MHPDSTQKRIMLSSLPDLVLYDMYAPAVYGNILWFVPHEPIAEKILEKIFITAFRQREELNNSLRAPLSNLLIQSRIRSQNIIHALNIFRQCCAGSTVSLKNIP